MESKKKIRWIYWQLIKDTLESFNPQWDPFRLRKHPISLIRLNDLRTSVFILSWRTRPAWLEYPYLGIQGFRFSLHQFLSHQEQRFSQYLLSNEETQVQQPRLLEEDVCQNLGDGLRSLSKWVWKVLFEVLQS